MDERLLRYYERELRHLRDAGGEFAREFPKIAGRLGLEDYACEDPYVERLLEGFSFLAARIQLKIDAEFPRFTEHLLELVYPAYLAPTPSMAIVRFEPDLTEGSLAAGFTLPRHTQLRGLLGKGDQTACEFRTAHAMTLWPLELVSAQYTAVGGAIGGTAGKAVDGAIAGAAGKAVGGAIAGTAGKANAGNIVGARAALRLRLRTTANLKFDELSLDTLQLFLRGSGGLPAQLHEQLFAHALAIVAAPPGAAPPWREIIDRSALRQPGFDDDEALLPGGPRSFSGYRLLHEYFAFPQRYMFVEIGGLAPACARCTGNELDVLVLFDRLEPALEQPVGAENFALFCAPAINLFPKRADRIQLTGRQAEYHVVPDRTRAADFEVYEIGAATGYGSGAEARQVFLPFYRSHDLRGGQDEHAYFQVRRAQRLVSARQRRDGTRSSYLGSETFVSLVDSREAPYRSQLWSDLRQLGLDTLCTNRDLPLSMPLGAGATDFTAESSAPVRSVRCVAGPTAPVASHVEGETAWRVISHLSLNYLSITDRNISDQDAPPGTVGLRDLLKLYVGSADTVGQRQIEGVRAVTSRPVARRLPGPGPIAFGRGLELTVTLDDAAFEGAGVVLFGAVLERFFARYVTLNSFTETVVRTLARGEIKRWPARSGQCQIL